jgi:hypothetical protein
LTNKINGSCYGSTKNWDDKKLSKCGAILLKKACEVYLREPERQIRETEVKDDN